MSDNKIHFAGLGIRLTSFLVDVLFITSFTYILYGVILNDIVDGWMAIILKLWTAWLYFWVFTWVYGQTLGKMITGICVVSTDSTRLAWEDALLREVPGRLVTFLIPLGFVLPSMHPYKQALHDRLAGTYVIWLDVKKEGG